MAATLAEAIGADYWKPVQAGFDKGTDTEWVRDRMTQGEKRVHPETYKLALPASPHIAAREEGITISIPHLLDNFTHIARPEKPLVIEGAGGLLVPLNATETVADLIKALGCRVILVSRNYLGSINHSLLTAAWCRQQGIHVAGWVFNDQYLNYEAEIVAWSGIPSLGHLPSLGNTNAETIQQIANGWKEELMTKLKP